MRSQFATEKAKRSLIVKIRSGMLGRSLMGMAMLCGGTQTLAVTGNMAWVEDSRFRTASCDYGCDPGCCDPVECGSIVSGGGGLFSGIGSGCVENFTLAGLLGLDDDSLFTIAGWSQVGYTDEATMLASLGGGSFNNIPNQVNLHQQWFYAERVADGSNGFDLGFRADIMYGIDGTDTQAFGNPGGSWDFENGWDHGIYSWAMPQLYGEVAMGDLSIKVGHFFTLIGYEVVPATGNFFFSHALTMYNSEPFTHTGAVATYTGIEGVTLYNGWTAGWDTGFDSLNSGSIYLGGVGLNLSEDVAITYICTYGNFGAISAGGEDYSHSVVATAALTDKLSYVFQSDYKKIDDSDDEDVGINQYLIYAINDIVSVGSRVEWWSDDTTSYNEFTTGANVKLLGNLLMRPEYRHDWSPANDYRQDIFACDMILTY